MWQNDHDHGKCQDKATAFTAGTWVLTMVAFLVGFLCLLLPWDEELLIALPIITVAMLPW